MDLRFWMANYSKISWVYWVLSKTLSFKLSYSSKMLIKKKKNLLAYSSTLVKYSSKGYFYLLKKPPMFVAVLAVQGHFDWYWNSRSKKNFYSCFSLSDLKHPLIAIILDYLLISRNNCCFRWECYCFLISYSKGM